MHTSDKAKYIKISGLIALFGNLVLCAVKMYLALKSKSMAVFGDALDSGTDVLIAVVTLVVGMIIRKPGDKVHPWGHERAETIATIVLAFVIFFAGSELCVTAINNLITGHFINNISIFAIISSVISIFGKLLLSITLFSMAKISKSEIIKANAKNMRADIIMSLGILAGLSVSKIFNAPFLDPVIATAVGLWVIKNAIEIFIEQNTELMDGNADQSLYTKLFNAVNSVRGVTNPHNARIRKIASKFDIDLDIETAPSMPLYEAHELAEQVEEAIREAIPETYAVTIHVEPLDSCTHQREEVFGLTPDMKD